jgi:GNAT superfamily N-acetyltransferase
MTRTPAPHITAHDEHPQAEARLIDTGIGEANDLAAPLHEVRPLSCFARAPSGEVLGGAVGRRWGSCCELQQLWVHPAHRRQGIGARLVRAFEDQARRHGCHRFYLETFSFQAPAFYASLGYRQAHALDVYPHGIVKLLMVKDDAA